MRRVAFVRSIGETLGLNDEQYGYRQGFRPSTRLEHKGARAADHRPPNRSHI